MGTVQVKNIFESSEELIEEIDNLIEQLGDKKCNSKIVKLYNDTTNYIHENKRAKKEEKRILTVIYYSLKKLIEKLSKRENIRKDLFFKESEDDISLVSELIEGIVISAQNEHEEKKLKYYGNLLANLMFREDLDRDECNRLIKISRVLSYCQVKLMALYGMAQIIQVPILQREDYTKIGVKDYKLLGVLQDTLDMLQKSILNASGNIVLDVVQINPSKIKVQGVGLLLYNNMSLDKLPYGELDDLLDILAQPKNK